MTLGLLCSPGVTLRAAAGTGETLQTVSVALCAPCLHHDYTCILCR